MSAKRQWTEARLPGLGPAREGGGTIACCRCGLESGVLEAVQWSGGSTLLGKAWPMNPWANRCPGFHQPRNLQLLDDLPCHKSYGQRPRAGRPGSGREWPSLLEI